MNVKVRNVVNPDGPERNIRPIHSGQSAIDYNHDFQIHGKTKSTGIHNSEKVSIAYKRQPLARPH